jgi:AbrB family looped-hinge helix DNA binding protein
MNFRRKLGLKGQVVVPRDVRQHLGIRSGSEVIFEVRNEEAVLRPGKAPSDVVNEYVSIISPKLKKKVRLEEIVEEEILEEIRLRR